MENTDMGKSPTEQSFDVVKEYVVAKAAELEDIELRYCPEAEQDYHKSENEQAPEGKLPRAFAHCLHEGREEFICYCSKCDTELTEPQRQGILIHEFGHIYANERPEEYEDADDPDADTVCLEVFGVVMHYDDNDIEYVQLPLGSEEIVELEGGELEEGELDEEDEDLLLEVSDEEGEEEEPEFEIPELEGIEERIANSQESTVERICDSEEDTHKGPCETIEPEFEAKDKTDNRRDAEDT